MKTPAAILAKLEELEDSLWLGEYEDADACLVEIRGVADRLHGLVSAGAEPGPLAADALAPVLRFRESLPDVARFAAELGL